MKRTAEVVIVGGGCMGASVACYLARRGMTEVVLVEREKMLAMGSTGRNAGGVRHQFSNAANIRLSIESIGALERFADEVGQPIDFHQDGYLFLLSTQAGVETFRRNVALQRRLGVDVEWLDAQDAARLAPGLRADGVVGATFCQRDGIADPNGVTMGLAKRAPADGVGGLFLINGFSGHGFQHSPAAGRILADIITGHDPHFDLTPFAPERFAAPAAVSGERYFV